MIGNHPTMAELKRELIQNRNTCLGDEDHDSACAYDDTLKKVRHELRAKAGSEKMREIIDNEVLRISEFMYF